MTEKQIFIYYLKGIYNAIESPVLQTIPLIPSYMKDSDGNHHLIGNIHVSILGGSNVKEGDLGCVTFCYFAKTRKKGCRTINEHSELLKKVIIPENALEAIKQFKYWEKRAFEIIQTWTEIL